MAVAQEEATPMRDPAFATALARGLIRFAGLLDAKHVNIRGIGLPALRKQLKQFVGEPMPLSVRAVKGTPVAA
jgi:hypothetical protein